MVPDLLQAVSQLGDLVHLHLFGDGPEREAIHRTTRLLNLESRVTLHGSIPRPQDALSQIGLLVLPSISEGMPMVLIEAMAAGVPVIGRNVPGVKDVIVEKLGVDADKVVPEARFVEDLGADSLETVELIMGLEDKFGVTISDEDAESIRTVQAAVDYIENKQ